MADRIAFFNGQFVPAEQLAVSPHDLGFAMGVTISERLRTFGGQLFRLDDHLRRLRNSLHEVGLADQVDTTSLKPVIEQLTCMNHAQIAPEDDLAIALFVTPGFPGQREPTIAVEAFPLPFAQWVSWYDNGLALVETGVRQVPANCWPPALKCRCRIHYYRADQLAHRQRAGARAILLDQEGFVTESSTANILVYRQAEGLISPPLEKILPGVSLAVVAQLAEQLGMAVQYRDMKPEEVLAADEVVMCGTSPCVWPVSDWNDRPVGKGAGGPAYRALLDAWNRLVGLDIVAQAKQFARRGG